MTRKPPLEAETLNYDQKRTGRVSGRPPAAGSGVGSVPAHLQGKLFPKNKQ